MTPKRFSMAITAEPKHIDVLGHVNNAVWIEWIQDVATAHWESSARPEHVGHLIWVVTRHEVDYLAPLHEGETVTATTWIDPETRGARSLRQMEFCDADGKLLVRAKTSWALIDQESRRPMRVRPDMLAPFFAD